MSNEPHDHSTAGTEHAVAVSRIIWQHKKRGTTYQVMTHFALLQCASDQEIEDRFKDLNWTIYRSREDGAVYVRLTSEFMDGRFERIGEESGDPAQTPSCACGNRPECDQSCMPDEIDGFCSHCGHQIGGAAQAARNSVIAECRQAALDFSNEWRKKMPEVADAGLDIADRIDALAAQPPAAPVEKEPMVCDKCNEVMAAAVGLPISDARLSADNARPAGFVKPDNDRQVFFYEQDCYVLSNVSAFNLRWRGHRFATSEQAYHWEKFCGIEPKVAWKVMDAPSAHEAFKIAEQYKHCRRPDWDEVKVDIMRGIIRAKFDQHEYVRRKLLATGDRELIEDSWRDDFWGWGPNRDGKNMLGRLWMDLRNQMAAELDGGQR